MGKRYDLNIFLTGETNNFSSYDYSTVIWKKKKVHCVKLGNIFFITMRKWCFWGLQTTNISIPTHTFFYQISTYLLFSMNQLNNNNYFKKILFKKNNEYESVVIWDFKCINFKNIRSILRIFERTFFKFMHFRSSNKLSFFLSCL